jgi:hypothetical protein
MTIQDGLRSQQQECVMCNTRHLAEQHPDSIHVDPPDRTHLPPEQPMQLVQADAPAVVPPAPPCCRPRVIAHRHQAAGAVAGRKVLSPA